jgi:hypothetical protein
MRTLRRLRHTSFDSKHNHQIGHLHHSFLCKTYTGCLPRIYCPLRRRSQLGGLQSRQQPRASGLTPFSMQKSFNARRLRQSPQARRSATSPCSGQGNNGLFE